MKYEIEIDGGNFVLQYEITQDEYDLFMEHPNVTQIYVFAYNKLLNDESNFAKDVANDFWYLCPNYSIFIRIGAWTCWNKL